MEAAASSVRSHALPGGSSPGVEQHPTSRATLRTKAAIDRSESPAARRNLTEVQDRAGAIFPDQIEKVLSSLSKEPDISKHAIKVVKLLTEKQKAIEMFKQSSGPFRAQMGKLETQIEARKQQLTGVSPQDLLNDPEIKALQKSMDGLQMQQRAVQKDHTEHLQSVDQKILELAMCYVKMGKLPDNKKLESEQKSLEENGKTSSTEYVENRAQMEINDLALQQLAKVCLSETAMKNPTVEKFLKNLSKDERKALVGKAAEEALKSKTAPPPGPLGFEILKEIHHQALTKTWMTKYLASISPGLDVSKYCEPKALQTAVKEMAKECYEKGSYPPQSAFSELVLQEMQKMATEKSLLGAESPLKQQYIKIVADKNLRQASLPSKSDPLHSEVLGKMADLCGKADNPYNAQWSRAGGSGETYRVSVKSELTQKQEYLLVVKREAGEPEGRLGDPNKKPTFNQIEKYFTPGSSLTREHVTNTGYLSKAFGYRHSSIAKVQSFAFKEKNGSPSMGAETCLVTDFIRGSVGTLQPIETFGSALGLEFNKLLEENAKSSTPKTGPEIRDLLERERESIVAAANTMGATLPPECFTPLPAWPAGRPIDKASIDEFSGKLEALPGSLRGTPIRLEEQAAFLDKLDRGDVQRIALYHLIYGEADPNSGNVLVVPEQRGETTKLRLQPIDAGQSTPGTEPSEIKNPAFWKLFPMIKGDAGTIEPEIKAQIEALDVETEASRIEAEFKARGDPLAAKIADVFRANAYFVKAAVAKGKKIGEISSNMPTAARIERCKNDCIAEIIKQGMKATPDMVWGTYEKSIFNYAFPSA